MPALEHRIVTRDPDRRVGRKACRERNRPMNLRAGERTSQQSNLECARCGRKIQLNRDDRIPTCTCGSREYRTEEEEEEEES